MPKEYLKVDSFSFSTFSLTVAILTGGDFTGLSYRPSFSGADGLSAFSTFTEDEDHEVLQLHYNHHNADPKFIDFSKDAPPISPFTPNL